MGMVKKNAIYFQEYIDILIGCTKIILYYYMYISVLAAAFYIVCIKVYI